MLEFNLMSSLKLMVSHQKVCVEPAAETISMVRCVFGVRARNKRNHRCGMAYSIALVSSTNVES